MASIGTALPVTNSTAVAGTSSNSNSNSQNALGDLGNTSTFLSLLVAQLQYQDPTDPVDGTALFAAADIAVPRAGFLGWRFQCGLPVERTAENGL